MEQISSISGAKPKTPHLSKNKGAIRQEAKVWNYLNKTTYLYIV